MNRNYLIVLLLVISPFFLKAQVDESKPVKVSKAVAYAKSRPLAEIAAKLSPNKEDAIPVVKVNKNKLDMNKWPQETGPTEAVQTTMGTRESRGPQVGFNGQGNTGYFPPDTDGDVSADHFVQVVNSKYNVYTKTGTKLLGPLNLSTLWSDLPGPWVGTNDGDPIVVFDEEAERWVITQFALPTSTQNFELFAVSETSDPLGAYHLYAFAFGVQFNDYPKISVWRDGYYATYNLFSNNYNPSFLGSKITVVEREKMLVGDPDASMIEFLKNNYYATMPADIDGEALPEVGQPCPVMFITSAKTIQLWGLSADWDTPANSYLNLMVTLNPSNFSQFNGNITQPNGQSLDALQAMIMNRLAYRKFDGYASMVTNHTVYANGKAGIRWYEMRRTDGGNWTLHQEGTFAPNADVHRWMGSAAINGYGDIGLAYSVTSATVHPSLRYTGRKSTDPVGVMTIEEVELKTGTSSQSGMSRWGDYADLNVDPANDTIFWFTSEYNGWSTWISSFDLGGIGSATAYAGEDAYICVNGQYQTQGSGSGVLSILWTTDGDGFFSPANQFNSTYIRGSQDVANGGCTLTMTVTGYDGVEVSDNMYLNIVPWVKAGDDATILDTDAFQLEATGADIGTIQWTTSGDGSFSDATIMQPIYTPGPQDINNGVCTLSVNLAITEPCVADDDDSMILHISGVGVNELTNANRLSVYPNPTSDVFTFTVNQLNAGEEFSFYVYNSHGKEVYRQVAQAKSNSYERTLDMSAFNPGVYFISVNTQSGTITQKVVKK